MMETNISSIIYFGDGRWRVGAMGIDAFHMLNGALNGYLFWPFHFLLGYENTQLLQDG